MEGIAADEPQFGVVDIVDAFTAMRHEWRGQTKESRRLAETIEAAVATLQRMESTVLAREEQAEAARRDTADADSSTRLAQLVAETDHQLTRAVLAFELTERHRRDREQQEAAEIEAFAAGRFAITRWLFRPLLRRLSEQRKERMDAGQNPAMEGLNVVLARLRRSMQDMGIERVDTAGRPFDATLMNAIGTVATADDPPGHVAEQLAPCYRWQGQVLKFADVRVARPPADAE